MLSLLFTGIWLCTPISMSFSVTWRMVCITSYTITTSQISHVVNIAVVLGRLRRHVHTVVDILVGR